jgi:predicted O-linked N-acetylglucosamine transferase (SPINDLY family)
MDDRRVAALLDEAGIDIAVDLKGYTAGARPGILAWRAAPVQVSYLGYPGTLGAPYVDYVIADRWVAPVEHEAGFTECVVRLPHSYQVNDRRRAIAARAPSRSDLGLPEHGFVFACFNNNYKITPEVFAVWMRLLQAVPDSVLWLYQASDTAAHHLRAHAQAHGVQAQRLIFAPRLPGPEHLARLARADLFLDTLPVNAHTTASDALWAGLPVLTCAGGAFAARVAASLLSAVGLPELITTSLADYEALARKLALEPQTLQALRTRLAGDRSRLPLFDTPRYCSHLERAYQAMHERVREGLPPQGFDVTPD